MNQIRSAFAHSILSWHFPGINFYSAGISTSGGIPVNGNMLNFLTKLGIPHAKNVSNGYMEVANSGTQFDLVITAEPYMSSFLEKKSSQEILMDYMDGAESFSFIPKDPIF